MSIEQEVGYENNSGFPLDQEQSQMFKEKYRRQARQLIAKLDLDSDSGRHLLAKSYRKINGMIDRLQKDRFNLNEDSQFLEDVVKNAFFYQPYDINNPTFKYGSSFYREALMGNRRLNIPVVKIGEEIVNQDEKIKTFNVDTSQFTLRIQSEPTSMIIYTTKPNSHPLLEPNQVQPPYQKKYCNSNQFVQTISAPCQLNIVVASESKIESKLINIKVTTHQNVNEFSRQNFGDAVRPAESYPFEDSYVPNSSRSQEEDGDA